MRRGMASLAGALGALACLAPAGQGAPSMPADAFTDAVGVNTHVMYLDTPYRDTAATIRALRYLGVRNVRDGISAPALPQGAGFRREQQRRFTALGREGIRLLLIAGGPDKDGNTVAGRLALARGLPGLRAVEGPNEWDLKGGPDWASTLPVLQRRLAATAGGDPILAARGVEVVGPSFGRPENAAQVGDLSDAMDLGNLHTYTGGRQPEEGEGPGMQGVADRIGLVGASSADLPLLVTEIGYHDARRVGGHVSEDTAAIYTLRTVLEHARIGIRRTYLYELFDEFRDPLGVSAEANFGLFEHDGEPKPAALALRRLMRLARDGGASPQSGLDVRVAGAPKLRTLVLAKSGGRFAVVVWRAVPVWEPNGAQALAVPERRVTVTLPRAFGTVRVRRPAELDDPAERWRDDARVQVSLGAAPVVLELTPGDGGAGIPGLSPLRFGAEDLPFV